MKRNALTLTVGILLLLIFGCLLISFQVRQGEVGLVTTFGKPSRSVSEPGLYGKLPWPIQKVQKFDQRIQTLETVFREVLTQDGQPIMVMVYAGWKIEDPAVFRERFAGSITKAESDLEGLVHTAQSAVVGKHPFSDFISTDEKQLKFVEIEREMLDAIRPQAKANYGVDVRFLGIKKLGLPESITQKVFERMKEERQRYVQKLQAEGDRAATNILSMANLEREAILANAVTNIAGIRGEAEKEAAKFYAVFEQNPELAVFLLKITALEQTLKERATVVLDPKTSPFDLLNQAGTDAEAVRRGMNSTRTNSASRNP
jgi:membrane protease subunit HflC